MHHFHQAMKQGNTRTLALYYAPDKSLPSRLRQTVALDGEDSGARSFAPLCTAAARRFVYRPLGKQGKDSTWGNSNDESFCVRSKHPNLFMRGHNVRNSRTPSFCCWLKCCPQARVIPYHAPHRDFKGLIYPL